MKMFGNKWKQDIEENEPYWDLCFIYIIGIKFYNMNDFYIE
jgi:hypothetical protein